MDIPPSSGITLNLYSFTKCTVLKMMISRPVLGWALNLLTPMSDQDRISPFNINKISTRYVMRIKKNINLGIIS